jgi:hypothetical protein
MSGRPGPSPQCAADHLGEVVDSWAGPSDWQPCFVPRGPSTQVSPLRCARRPAAGPGRVGWRGDRRHGVDCRAGRPPTMEGRAEPDRSARGTSADGPCTPTGGDPAGRLGDEHAGGPDARPEASVLAHGVVVLGAERRRDARRAGLGWRREARRVGRGPRRVFGTARALPEPSASGPVPASGPAAPTGPLAPSGPVPASGPAAPTGPLAPVGPVPASGRAAPTFTAHLRMRRVTGLPCWGSPAGVTAGWVRPCGPVSWVGASLVAAG